jgi:hypothetical protein
MAELLDRFEFPFANAIRDAVLDVIDLIEGREPVTNRELPSKLVVRADSSSNSPDNRPSRPSRRPTSQTTLRLGSASGVPGGSCAEIETGAGFAPKVIHRTDQQGGCVGRVSF